MGIADLIELASRFSRMRKLSSKEKICDRFREGFLFLASPDDSPYFTVCDLENRLVIEGIFSEDGLEVCYPPDLKKIDERRIKEMLSFMIDQTDLI